MLKNKIEISYKDWLSDGYFNIELKPLGETLDIYFIHNIMDETFTKHIVINGVDSSNITDMLYKYIGEDLLVILGLDNGEMDQVIEEIVENMKVDFIDELSKTIFIHKNHPLKLNFLQW